MGMARDPPGVAVAVSCISRTEREGGLAGRLPQAAPIEAPSSSAPEPMDQVPEGPRAGAGGRPECLPAAVLPTTPADQRECSRAACEAPLWPHAHPLARGHSVRPSRLPLPGAVSGTVLSWAVDRGPQGSASVPRPGHSALNLMGSLILRSLPNTGKGDGDPHVRGGAEGVGGRSHSSGQGRDL